MPKQTRIIVLSGHGAWDSRSKTTRPYVSLPGRCSIHFYQSNFTLLRDGSGQELEKGNLDGLTPEQEAGPYQSIPNMILTWPRGLTIGKAPKGWLELKYTIEEATPIPKGPENMQFQVARPKEPLASLLKDPLGHLSLEDIFKVLDPVIRSSEAVLFVWAACREVCLEKMKDEDLRKKIQVGVPKSWAAQFYPTQEKIVAELMDATWEYFDDWAPKLVPEFKFLLRTWVYQKRMLTEEDFYEELKLKEKLLKAQPEQREKMTKRFKKLWAALKVSSCVSNPLAKEVERLGLNKRRDTLSFKKAV